MKYTLNAPEELKSKLSLLAIISAFAKRLELNELAIQAKDIYFNLSSQWDEYAKEEVKKRNPNWFSRTVYNAPTYEYISANDWNMSYNSWEAALIEVDNYENLQKALRFYLKLWNTGKTSDYLSLSDLRELEKSGF